MQDKPQQEAVPLRSSALRYPRRLIEVDLPIKRISAHARREKSIRHGHISTLHIWWARRPLAACRAVLCAALWPDPADPLCPQAFRDVAAAAVHLHACNVQTVKAVMEITGEQHKVWAELTKRANRLDSSDANQAARWFRGSGIVLFRAVNRRRGEAHHQ